MHTLIANFFCIIGLSDIDYINVYSTRTFSSGSSNGATQCVEVVIVDDSTFEGNKSFTMTLTTADINVLLRTAVTTISLIDDES